MSSMDVAKLMKKAKPKLGIITHMGMAFLRAGPKKEAERISKEGGVKTLAAYDGMRIRC
jgi:phosphoribosyl 1,2-cyclic phosphodiesterase